jgi:hypothetical protein
MKGAIPAHPFQANLLPLRKLFEEACGSEGKGATETVWLPAIDGVPPPSPELAFDPGLPNGKPEPTLFRVKGRVFSRQTAMGLLTRLPGTCIVGADWKALRKACLLALEAVVAQEVYPTVEPMAGYFRARWALLPDSGVEERIDKLIAALPAAARSAAPEPAAIPSARRTVESLLGAVIDTQVRETARAAADNTLKTAPYQFQGGMSWVRALSSLESDVLWGYYGVISGPYEKWVAKFRERRVDPLRLTFRLEPPETEALPWRLSFHLQPREAPGVTIPAYELWER